MNVFQLKRAFRPALWIFYLAVMFFVIFSLRGYLNPPNLVKAQTNKYNWLQFGGDPEHSGANYSETTINASNVSGLKSVFTLPLNAGTDAAPVFLTGITTTSGVRDLGFVNDKLGGFYAFDAHTGAVIWTAKAAGGFNNSSPAIDPNLQFVYFPGADGFAHKYNVANGVEVTSGGFPARITSCSGTKIPPALGIATDASGVTRLYGASSGFGSCPYGNITAIDLATGTQHVFNMVCSNLDLHIGAPGNAGCGTTGAGVWSRGGETYDPATNLIYVATAEYHSFSPPNSWSQTLLAISPDGTNNAGNPVDSYTPPEYASEISADTDLGSSTATVLPDLPGSNVAHVVLMCGKDAKMRLLNANNMSGQGGPRHTGGDLSITTLPQGGEEFSQIALWNEPSDNSHWVIAASTKGIAGLVYTLNSANNPTLIPKWHLTNGWVTSPVVANSIVFAANEAGQVFALDLKTGNQLWSAATNGRHWSSAVVANGMVYVTDGFGTTGGRLLAFGLPGGGGGGNPPPAPTGLTAAAGNNQVALSWTAAAGATSYNVKRSTTSGSNYTVIQSGLSATSFTDTTVTNGTTYFYVVSSQNAQGESPNSSQVSATPASGPPPPPSSIAINAGGPAVAPFVADTDFAGGATINHANTINTSNVTNPAPAAVYQTARVTTTAGSGSFTYTIPGLTAGTNYLVRLHFAETFWTTAGSRTFNVSINGTQVLTNFDIFAVAGGENIANVQQFTQAANASGQFVITFTSVKDKALISGIEVNQTTTTPPPPSCTSICIDSGSTTAVSPFVADTDFSGGATINHANTINTSNVTNPAPAAVYQTARVTATAGAGTAFSYTIGGFTAGSSHTVRLHFCETFHTTAGSRQFNVSINGTQVLTNFDIFATAGGQNIANIQQFTATADASGNITLTFTSVTDKALISGIEVQ
jgi:outer membrane protein assembly factor BamB